MKNEKRTPPRRVEQEGNPAAGSAPIDLGHGITATLVTRRLSPEAEAELAATIERVLADLVRRALSTTESSQ